MFNYTLSNSKSSCETKKKLDNVNNLVECYIDSFNKILTTTSYERCVFSCSINDKSILLNQINKVNIYIIFRILLFR